MAKKTNIALVPPSEPEQSAFQRARENAEQERMANVAAAEHDRAATTNKQTAAVGEEQQPKPRQKSVVNIDRSDIIVHREVRLTKTFSIGSTTYDCLAELARLTGDTQSGVIDKAIKAYYDAAKKIL